MSTWPIPTDEEISILQTLGAVKAYKSYQDRATIWLEDVGYIRPGISEMRQIFKSPDPVHILDGQWSMAYPPKENCELLLVQNAVLYWEDEEGRVYACACKGSHVRSPDGYASIEEAIASVDG